MLFYQKFNKLNFLSEEFFRISFSCRDIGKQLKKCTFFQDCGLLVCSMGSRKKHVYQNSDPYRLMFFFIFFSNLTGLNV